MKRLLLFISCCFFINPLVCQTVPELDTEAEEAIVVDSLYREDQFYVGFTYNLILNRPTDVSQSGFSGGLQLGFIRDMPINKRRNVAFGVGLGYSLNVFNHNLLIDEDEATGASVFSSLKGIDFNTNRFATHLFEAPIEFRWRTSVPESHKFYRIYTGIRVGYMYYFRSRFDDGTREVKLTNIEEVNPWRIGATFTFGWNTFNFHFYYSLNPLFEDSAQIDGEKVNINTARVGLMFYIL